MQRRVSRRRLVYFSAVLALAAAGARARAQVPEPFDAPEIAVDESVPTVEQFDQWVDQIVAQINEQDFAAGGRLDTRLNLTLEWLEASCKISEAQKKKLQIAGRGDIKRFLDGMREKKRRYRQIKADVRRLMEMQQRLAQIQASCGDDFFGKASLFSKTLHTTLSEEQAAMYANARAVSRSFAQRAAVGQAVRYFDMAVGLNERQRGQLTELLLEEARQSKTSESSELSLVFAMVLRTTKLPRGKLKAIFDEQRRWKVMSDLLKQLGEGFEADQHLGGLFGGDNPGMPANVLAEEPVLARDQGAIPESLEPPAEPKGE